MIGPSAANRAEETQLAYFVASWKVALRKTDNQMVHLARVPSTIGLLCSWLVLADLRTRSQVDYPAVREYPHVKTTRHAKFDRTIVTNEEMSFNLFIADLPDCARGSGRAPQL